jgi:hypothetical protein
MMVAMTASPVPDVQFRERLLPGPSGWFGVLGAGLLAALVCWPLGTALGVAVGVGATIATGVALAVTSPVVEVRDAELRAGRAHVPVSLLGEVTAVTTPEEMRTELGPRLDARAYVCLRAWARTGVRAVLEDPADPTPYWLVSTRRPEELAAVLRGAGA